MSCPSCLSKPECSRCKLDLENEDKRVINLPNSYRDLQNDDTPVFWCSIKHLLLQSTHVGEIIQGEIREAKNGEYGITSRGLQDEYYDGAIAEALQREKHQLEVINALGNNDSRVPELLEMLDEIRHQRQRLVQMAFQREREYYANY